MEQTTTDLHPSVELWLYVHRNRRLIRDGSPGRPPRLSHSSWALYPPVSVRPGLLQGYYTTRVTTRTHSQQTGTCFFFSTFSPASILRVANFHRSVVTSSVKGLKRTCLRIVWAGRWMELKAEGTLFTAQVALNWLRWSLCVNAHNLLIEKCLQLSHRDVKSKLPNFRQWHYNYIARVIPKMCFTIPVIDVSSGTGNDFSNGFSFFPVLVLNCHYWELRALLQALREQPWQLMQTRHLPYIQDKTRQDKTRQDIQDKTRQDIQDKTRHTRRDKTYKTRQDI